MSYDKLYDPYTATAAFVELGAATDAVSDVPIDMHNVIKTGNLPRGVEAPREIARALLDVDSWLPFAAEAYNVSSNLKDFIVVPTTIFWTEIPNANMAAFSFEEMSAWNAQAGDVSYRTWRKKPTFAEHANADHTQAKGIIFDSSMRPVPNYVGGLYRVVLLNGWDRDRDAALAARVSAGRHGYSMGCWVQDYNCSVCAASLRKGGCAHIHPKAGILQRSVGNKLTYRIARGCQGFECSAVATPAFRSAMGEPIG